MWDVNEDQYGAWVAIVGTLTTALIALVIGVPLSLGIAIFLTQLCPPWLKRPVATTIELLAAVPSIIYGMWGLFVFAPLFASLRADPGLEHSSRACPSSAPSSMRACPPASAS